MINNILYSAVSSVKRIRRRDAAPRLSIGEINHQIRIGGTDVGTVAAVGTGVPDRGLVSIATLMTRAFGRIYFPALLFPAAPFPASSSDVPWRLSRVSCANFSYSQSMRVESIPPASPPRA